MIDGNGDSIHRARTRYFRFGRELSSQQVVSDELLNSLVCISDCPAETPPNSHSWRLGMCTDAEVRDRAKRLYQFIGELIALRHVPVRRIDNYELVIPLGDLPAKPDVLFIARSDFDGAEDDAWLEVRCPRVESYPTVPPILRDWLDPAQLADPTREMPELQTGSTISNNLGMDADDEDSLDENGPSSEHADVEASAEIKAAWEGYVSGQWWPWAEQTRPKYRAKKLYDDLFRMYQKQEHFGETFEVVAGFGLLTWKSSVAVDLRRHLITVPLTIELDSRRQILTLRPPASGVELRLEEDMIDAVLRPTKELRDDIKTALREADTSIWSSVRIHDLLKQYCHALTATARYDSSTTAPNSSSESPVVTFAPALIMRKRGAEGLADFVEKIVTAIDDPLVEIPDAVRQQVCVVDPNDESEQRALGYATEEDDEVYFPLPANREQRRIVDNVRSASGVVVEGAPGTGKSQTIANLICHLLATGNRVLVTSHTARALQVLHDKIPETVRPLCVQALSNDKKGMDALEYSVRGITDRHLTWNRNDVASAITDAKAKLRAARERLQVAIHDQRAIRESEVFVHSGIAGRYSGTLAQIARRLKEEESELGLILDPISFNHGAPCSASSFWQTVELLCSSPSGVKLASTPRPPGSEDLIATSAFRDLATTLDQAILATAGTTSNDQELVRRIRALPEQIRKSLSNEVDRIDSELAAVRARRTEPWLDTAIKDIFNDRDRKWRDLHTVTTEKVTALRSIPTVAIEARVKGHESHDAHTLKHHADVIRKTLQQRNGRGLGIRLLLPAQVRIAVNVLEKVDVNGTVATVPEAIDVLRSWADTSIMLGLLDNEWAAFGDVPAGTFRARINEYDDSCEPLAVLLGLLEKGSKVSSELQAHGIIAPNWHDTENVDALRRAFRTADALDSFDRATDDFTACTRRLLAVAANISDTALRSKFERAVRDRDSSGYESVYASILSMREQWERENDAATTLEKLSTTAPRLLNALCDNPTDSQWKSLAERWDAAWAWAAAHTWIMEMTDSDAERRASHRVSDEQKRINALVGELAASKAWSYCFMPERMTEPRRQALQAWSNAVKRIGKGTGRYANQHRRAAREHITKCQPAIPAWIMPLYRVAESVSPTGPRFDVAIIDEASQSGPEALALLFVADKIVVVGDNKQISPDTFTRVEDVNRLRRELIPDLPANDAIDPENSLFDLAVIRYPSRVRLVEHFRCMPEIIQFSNDLCYSSEPLLPLRQFGAGRIEPVVCPVNVPSGYVSGTSQKVNRPEATAIARKIATLIQDDRYVGKSIGVISLLGERQARLIETELLSMVDARKLHERSIICGDAYDFQGDERDIMFLSLVVAPSADQPIRALTDPKGRDTRRYNVAMSRAKDQVWLFHSATLNDLSPNDLRYQLLRYCQNPLRKQETVGSLNIDEVRIRARAANRAIERPPGLFGSWFEVDVFLRVVDKGYTVVPQYDVSGYFIDLAVIGAQGKLAVECDGEYWHGPDQWDSDAARQRDLERCGWPFFRIRESAFCLDPDSALAPLWSELCRHGIASNYESQVDMPSPVFSDENESSLHVPSNQTEDTDEVGEAELQGPQDSTLPTYVEWTPQPVPNPRTASRGAVVNALVDIVRTEGPVTWSRVFDLYRIGLNLGRLKGPTRAALVETAQYALRLGTLVEWSEGESSDTPCHIVRTPQCESVRVRQRGPRSLEDVPPSEIAELIRQRDLLSGSDEHTCRAVLAAYGLRRLTRLAASHLAVALELAKPETPTR